MDRRQTWLEYTKWLSRNLGLPGEVLYVHQHGVLLHMQLISYQQQLHQLLIKTYVEFTKIIRK